MKMALRIGITLSGLLLVYLAFGFLTDPVGSGAGFGLSLDGPHAITSIRADMTAFFSVSGLSLIWGAWRNNPTALVIGAALMLVTLAARLVGLAVDGPFEGHVIPMVVELIIGALGLIGAKVLPDTA